MDWDKLRNIIISHANFAAQNAPMGRAIGRGGRLPLPLRGMRLELDRWHNGLG